VAPQGVLPIVADQFATVTVVTTRSCGARRRDPGDVLFAKLASPDRPFAPGAASRPIVRGLDNYRVRIQENGVSNSGVSELGEDTPFRSIPSPRARSRWCAAPRRCAGVAAIGGVVNVENNRIPTALPCRLAFLPTAEN
jgi:iron complex outermembrane receptor protein